MGGGTSGGKEEVREAVEVTQGGWSDEQLIAEADQTAFGPAADGPGDVKLSAGRSATRQDKVIRRRGGGSELVDGSLEFGDSIVGDR